MGNICRSPTADGVMRKLVEDAGLQHAIEIDSAGTHGYHVGAPPDARSQAAARRRGYDLSPLRARQVESRDFTAFDLLLAADNDNLDYLQRHCPPHLRDRVHLIMEFARNKVALEVPDPYHEGAQGFEIVLDYIEDACGGLLAALRVR